MISLQFPTGLVSVGFSISPGYHLKSQTISGIEFIECEPDLCTCENGIGFQAEKCKEHQTEFCESCDFGYL